MGLAQRLSSLVIALTGGQPDPEPEPVLEDLTSSLMVDVFSQVPASRQLHLLDFGVASAATVNFLNHFNCRVSFLDLLSCHAQIEAAESEQREYGEDFVAFSHDQLVAQYTTILDGFEVESLDICLFWDLPNYLPAEHINALMMALAPRLHAHSCAHLIGIYNAHSTVTPVDYGLRDLVSMVQRRTESATAQRFHPYRQGELDNLLTHYKIDRSRLLGKGLVEYLLFHRDRFGD